VNIEFKRIWKWSWHKLESCPGISLGRLMETTEYLNHNSQSTGQNLKMGPPTYEAEVLPTQLTFYLDYE
jgi:hypothetical protein